METNRSSLKNIGRDMLPAQAQDSGFPLRLSALIHAALSKKDCIDAFRLCETRIEQNPKDADAFRHLGLLHAAAGTFGSAVNAAKRACELTPDDVHCWNDLGRVYAMLGELEDAALCFNESVEIDVKFAEGWHNLGTACKQLGKRDLAFSAFKNALLVDPTRADTYLNLGALLIQANQFEDALECFERAVKHDPTLVSARSRLAGRLSQRGKVKRAESLFRQSVVMNPDHIEGWLGLGRTLEDMGEAESALSAYLNVLQRCSNHALALSQYLAIIPKDEDATVCGVDWLHHAEIILRDEQVKDAAKSLVGYGLVKYHNKRKDYQSAANAGLLANAARRRSSGSLDRNALRERVDKLIATYTSDFFHEHRSLGIGTHQPVFIVGLPRSGTTLTEQILSAHPMLHGGGELPDLSRLAAFVLSESGKEDSALWQAALLLAAPTHADAVDGVIHSRVLAGKYLKVLRDGAPKRRLRISDKSPLNFFQFAFVALLFPNARVVHCQRDVRDNALSVWMENFNPDQQWSTDFDDLAFYRCQYQRLMAHWHTVLPLPILDMQYENTVADLEGQAKRLIDFLGVPWDEHCLNFHKNERAVQTPSRWQVRQQIYKSSVGRWQDYIRYLPQLKHAFTDFKSD